jgi:DNA-binding MurR/RpiR family transcriptional regulator
MPENFYQATTTAPATRFDVSLRPPAFSEFIGQEKVKERLLLMIEAAKQRGVKLVLFTDLDLSPIADIADVVVPVTVECTSPLETLAVAIAATDSMLARLVRRLGAQAQRRMALLETLRHDASIPKLA